MAASLTVPSPSWFTGVTTIAGSWERPTYQTSPATVSRPAMVSRQARRRALLAVADWVSSRLRWSMGLALDTWDRDRHVAMDAALDARGAGDRISMSAGTVLAAPTGPGQRFATDAVQVALRSTCDRIVVVDARRRRRCRESTHTPFDLCAGAGAGQAHTPLLRAHPLRGGGARFSLPGRGGTMRVDVARGLRDGRVVVSAGWLAPWPGR